MTIKFGIVRYSPYICSGNQTIMEKKQKSLVNRFAKWFMAGLIVVVFGVSYVLFYLEERATRQFYSEIYHNKMRITNEYTRRVISDVYVAVTNNLYYLEHSLDNPDNIRAAMKRIVESGTRVRSCGVSFIKDYYPQKGHLYRPYAWRDANNPDEIYSQDMGDADLDYLKDKWFLSVIPSGQIRSMTAMTRQQPYRPMSCLFTIRQEAL